jgi:hypothetical protein
MNAHDTLSSPSATSSSSFSPMKRSTRTASNRPTTSATATTEDSTPVKFWIELSDGNKLKWLDKIGKVVDDEEKELVLVKDCEIQYPQPTIVAKKRKVASKKLKVSQSDDGDD